jgi:hypothetical protein
MTDATDKVACGDDLERALRKYVPFTHKPAEPDLHLEQILFCRRFRHFEMDD